jgi:uncharacterized membrane protein YgcG
MVARSLLTVLMLTASAMFFAPFASAQGSDTVFDEAGTLSAAEERDVQAALIRQALSRETRSTLFWNRTRTSQAIT